MNDKDDFPPKTNLFSKQNGSEKKTSFATLPNTTTWQQQSSNTQQQSDGVSEDSAPNNLMNIQLNDIRMKLEEKRRHIENEKRRMELAMNKQRQKVGKAAFLQAVAKVSVEHHLKNYMSASIYMLYIYCGMHFVGWRLCIFLFIKGL